MLLTKVRRLAAKETWELLVHFKLKSLGVWGADSFFLCNKVDVLYQICRLQQPSVTGNVLANS